MNITHESTGQLTATIRINVEECDYQEKVEKILRDHRRKATLPGFRPGMVPFGMIRRMYGKAVMADEIQKLISESLENYIKENQLEILGQPLPNEEHNERIDFESQTAFDFYFDIGLSPRIDLVLDDRIETPYYTIAVDDTMLEDSLKDILHRNGKMVDTDVVENGATMTGEITELDNTGEPNTGGISRQTTIALNYLKDDQVREQFIGKAKGDIVVFNPLTTTGNANETAQMLGIKKEHAEILTSNFRFTIGQIQRIEPAQMDEELYRRLYPSEKITTESEFRELIRKDIAGSMIPDCDRQFMNTVSKILIGKANIDLPDAFLKRYLLEVNENKDERESIEKDYDRYARSLKWQLLENKLIKDYQVGIAEEEIRSYIRGYFKNRFGSEPAAHDHDHDHEQDHEHEHDHEHDHEHNHDHEHAAGEEDKDSTMYDSLIDHVMKNEEEIRKINDHLFDIKLRELFKSKLKVTHQEVSLQDFIRLSTETN
ncbi:MAG: trigger factor [Bacteroidales bacterium]|nr:trigger factor [Bacteroidales bacterium]